MSLFGKIVLLFYLRVNVNSTKSMVKNINLSKLRNAELLQFLTDGLGFVTADSTVSTAVSAPRIALANIVGVMDGLFAVDQASAHTDDLAALDIQRDTYITGLEVLCKAYTYHPVAVKRNAAHTLLHNLEVYGHDIARQGYNAESASISNLLDDWNTKADLVAAALQVAGTSDFLNALTTTNVAFIALYNQRTTDIAVTAGSDSMKNQRTEAISAWKALCKKIDANTEMVDGAAPWGTVVNQLNTLIDQYNATLHSRAGRTAAQKQEEQQPA